jgi:transcriptional regulator GlxA family with amidase domain
MNPALFHYRRIQRICLLSTLFRGSIASLTGKTDGIVPLVRIWVYDGILASSVAGAADIFTAANAISTEWRGRSPGKPPLLKWRIESLDGRDVQSASKQMISVDGPIDARSPADAVIVPGPFVRDVERFLEKTEVVAPLLVALRRQHERGVLLASYCTGSFLLAEAGLLDGGAATTHWAKGKVFARRYPEVDLQIADIITEQDGIICSGAVTSSLNLALRIVEKLAGADVAAETGKLMLIDTNRVSQTSYATRREEPHSDLLVARAQRWIEKSLQRGFNLGELARHLAVSERTLNRRFKQALGEPPLHYLQTLRVDVAKRLLETRRLKVDSVSERVGYGDLSTFRRLFKRETGLSPREYQRRFSRRGAAA